MAAEPFIVDLVAKLTELLRGARTLPPVYGYLPDDVAHLPVLVVGRPDMGPSDTGTPAVMTQRVDVVLLGRRIADADAQAELNGLGDECFDTLGGTRGVKAGIDVLRCVEVRAGTVTVAGQDMPAYSFTVARDVITC